MSSSSAVRFSLGRESANDGSFRRQAERVSELGLGRWAHAIGISLVDPLRDERGWAFTGYGFTDAVNGFRWLGEAYRRPIPATGPESPWPCCGKGGGVIVNNEPADMFRMLSTVFRPMADHPVDLYPEPLGDEIDSLGGGSVSVARNPRDRQL